MALIFMSQDIGKEPLKTIIWDPKQSLSDTIQTLIIKSIKIIQAILKYNNYRYMLEKLLDYLRIIVKRKLLKFQEVSSLVFLSHKVRSYSYYKIRNKVKNRRILKVPSKIKYHSSLFSKNLVFVNQLYFELSNVVAKPLTLLAFVVYN